MVVLHFRNLNLSLFYGTMMGFFLGEQLSS